MAKLNQIILAIGLISHVVLKAHKEHIHQQKELKSNTGLWQSTSATGI